MNKQIQPCTRLAKVIKSAGVKMQPPLLQECVHACVFTSVGSVAEPPDRSMKCDCGAGAAPDQVLGFDNAPTKNALQAAAKWACRFSGVGSQVLVRSAPDPRWPSVGRGGEGRSGPLLFRKMEEKEERRGGQGRRGGGGCRFVCSCKLGLYGFE